MSHPTVIHGDCLVTLRSMPDSYVDAIVTDPPYGLAAHKTEVVSTTLAAWVTGDRESVPSGRGFMGKEWDAFVPPPAVWDECMRVLKPGGHMLVFAGSRTVDLMGLSIRLAGFEIRDTLQWLYGTGFPKSLDVSKAIDKSAGADRKVVGYADRKASLGSTGVFSASNFSETPTITAPATDAAREWEGWGTALKPAAEPIILSRKPLVSTVAANVLEYGTGGINVDACRVGTSDKLVRPDIQRTDNDVLGKGLGSGVQEEPPGRSPANVVLSHAEERDDECAQGCAVDELDSQSGTLTSGALDRSKIVAQNAIYGAAPSVRTGTYEPDSGGASRFFATFRYQAKAPTSERPKVNGVAHPTVKPVALMRWLTRLITSPNGTVLDPFAGSGTTLQAARDEGFDSIGIERESNFIELITERLSTAA